MNKINGKIAVSIVFLILVVLSGLFIKIPINMIKQAQEPKVGGLYIQFENGITELEVKTILENYNMTMDYTIYYNSDDMLKRYYIPIDEGKKTDIIYELRKNENWTSEVEIKKGNYSIIMLPEDFTPDTKFLTVLEKNNLSLKKTVVCYICLGDGSTSWISEKDATRIKNELETNKKIFDVFLAHIDV